MADWQGLTSKSFNEVYYEQHKAEGLDYLHYGDWQYRYARWLADSFNLAGTSVLDVGCACGNLVQGFHDQGCRAVGVDVNQHTIALGRERFPDVRLEVCDAANLHLFHDGQFGFVHSMQSAEHWPLALVPHILRELWRVAAPGAMLFCVLDTQDLGERSGRDLSAEDPTHQTIKPLFWWHEWLRACGWAVVSEDWRCTLLEHGWSYLPNYDWDWFVAVKLPEQSPWPLIPCEGWWVRQDFAFGDHAVIQEVFHGECYGGFPIHPGTVVVDIGAHIGAFAKWCHKHEPLAQIIAVEANPANIGCLQANCPFAIVELAAITYEDSPVLLSTCYEGSPNTGGSEVVASADAATRERPGYKRAELTKALTLEQLLDQHGFDRCILKIDAEGSEFSILENCDLSRIDRIVGEWHDRGRFLDLVARRFPGWKLTVVRDGNPFGLFRLDRVENTV